MNPVPQVNDKGFITDQKSGLLVPETYHRNTSSLTSVLRTQSPLNRQGFNEGYAVNRESQTLAIQFPQKGSGLDDMITGAFVEGRIANVGVSPVPSPQLAAIVKKQQDQAATASLELTGRKTPVGQIKRALSHFNDSPLGVTDALRKIVHGLRTYNRGAPIATVPITYAFHTWEDYGLQAIPLLKKGETEENAKRYALAVDWNRIGTPIPFLPNVFDLEPTGHPLYPYWYRVYRGKNKNDYVWVLLHKSHIIPLTPGTTNTPCVGTSAAWMYMGVLAESVLITDERLERKMNAISDGLLGIGGMTETAGQIQAQVEETKENSEMLGNILANGYTILVSESQVNFAAFRFRQHDGTEFKDWREWEEDVLALCMGDPLSAITTRGGVGFGSQADTAAEQSADSGVRSLLHQIGIGLGSVYKRIMVAINMPNDRSQRLNISTLETFSKAVAKLPESVMSPEEMRAIIDRDILRIPDISDNATNAGTTSDDSTDEQDLEALRPVRPLLAQARYYFEPVEPDGAEDPLPENSPNAEAAPTADYDEAYPDDEAILEAEVSDDDEPPEPDDDPTLTPWLWLSALYLYQRRRDGREVDREVAVDRRTGYSEIRSASTAVLANQLAQGDISLQTWVTLMDQTAEVTLSNNYRLGRGGVNAMTDADYAQLNTLVGDRFADIRNLASRIGEGRYTEAQISNFSGNIIRGSIEAFERGNAAAYGVSDLPAYPADGTTQCKKGDKCHWEIEQLDGEGNYDAYWRLAPAEHCPTCDERAQLWNPLEIRDGVYDTPIPIG